MAKFVTIGERLSTTAPAVNKAFTERDPEPILKRAKQQLDAGATYLDVNIGPAENDGPELMKWACLLYTSRSFLGTPHLAIPRPTNSSFLYAEAVSKRRYPFCTAAAIASSASTASVVL